ncbi:ATP-binding protein [Verrucomicrobiota bacterium sgz303538]
MSRIPSVPRSLFWKIYVWFLAAILLLAAAVTVTTYFTDPDLLYPVRRYVPIRLREQQATRAAEIFETRGVGELRQYFDSLTSGSGSSPSSSATGESYDHVYLFDSTGRELTGQVPPRGAAELVARVKASGDQNVELQFGRVLVARPANGPSRAAYVFLSSIPRKSLLIPAGLLGWLRFGIGLVAAAAVCYWLASHVLAPVEQLRTAARRLANGDLSARVSTPALATRRDEFSELASDFDHMATRIEMLLAAQRRLIADVSHELGSPLTRVNVALGIARRKAGAEAGPELERIERETKKLNEMIHQLLLLSQLESHAGLEASEDVDLRTLIQEVAADAEFEAANQERHVRVLAPESYSVRGTRHVLRSALENVVRNAVRYTAPNTEVSIELQASSSKDEAIITVRDHGPGVPSEALDKLFQPFYRVSDARDRQSGGTGLGLAIAEHAIKAHGGTARAQNLDGGGLAVEIRLKTAGCVASA